MERAIHPICEDLESRTLLDGIQYVADANGILTTAGGTTSSQTAVTSPNFCSDDTCDCYWEDMGPEKQEAGPSGTQLPNEASQAAGEIPDALPRTSGNPVRYFDGRPLIQSTDLASAGFGRGWGQTRTWSEAVGSSINGNGWRINQLPSLQRNGDDTEYVVITSATDTRHFTKQIDGTFAPAFMIPDSLKTASGEVIMIDSEGNQIHFYDFSDANHPGQFKSFNDASGAWAVTAVYDTSAPYQLQSIDQSGTQGTTSYKTSYQYEYFASANANSGQLKAVSLRTKQWTTGSTEPGWTVVQRVEYDYYDGSGTGANTYGNSGDLRTAASTQPSTEQTISSRSRSGTDVTITLTGHGYIAGDTVVIRGMSDDSLNGTFVVTSATTNTFHYTTNGGGGTISTATEGTVNRPFDVSYYRYYTSADHSSGYTGGLRLAFNPASYSRLASATSNAFTADLTTAQSFADNYFEYDATTHRVTLETAQGSGCSCSSGLGTSKFVYETNPRHRSAGFYPNVWYRKTTEILPDRTVGDSDNPRWIVYTNQIGEVLFRVFQEADETGYTGPRWGWFNAYDSKGRLTLNVEPAGIAFPAHLSTLEQYDVMLDNENTDTDAQYFFLRDATGLFTKYTYGSSTTATSSTAGDVTGYLKQVDISRGEKGTAAEQAAYTYKSVTATVLGTSVTRYDVASSSVFRNTNGTGEEKTTYAYTYPSNSVRPSRIDATLPTVTTAQNGPNSAVTLSTVYDSFGRPTWAKDGDGYITHFEYDLGSGAVTESIVDVDTARDTDSDGDDSEAAGGQTFSGLPSGWSAPTGGGKHLVSTFEADAFGRTTKATDPQGNVSFIVYNDPKHEVRAYMGWVSGTTTGPIQVSREYRPLPNSTSSQRSVYYETLTSSATPATSSGKPTGTETVDASNIQSLSRSVTNASGQVIAVYDYYAIPGTYTTADPTALGNVANDTGVSNTHYHLTTFSYDVQGRRNKTVAPTGTISMVVYDTLGRPVSNWEGTNATSATDTDPTGGGATGNNMKKIAEYQYDNGGVGDSNVTKSVEHPSSSSSDDRVQIYAYDWRDRVVVAKDGAQDVEDTTTHRPIIYYTYDNLNEVLSSERFDGDGWGLGDFTDGSLDTSFSGDGKDIRDIASGSIDAAYGLAVQSDGKIVVVGKAGNDFSVLRYNPDGSLDADFDGPSGSGNGKFTLDLNPSAVDVAYSVKIDGSGKILIAGESGGDFAVVRLNSDGTYDDSGDSDPGVVFGTGGISIVNFGSTDGGRALALQSDGKILVAGKSGNDFAVLRLNADGTTDNTFDLDGMKTTDVGTTTVDEARAIVVQPDGKIVVAGTAGSDFGIVRYTSSGGYDSGFGGGTGKATTDLGGGGCCARVDHGYALAIQADGKILVAGDTSANSGVTYDFGLVRYKSDGTLDSTEFGTSGRVITSNICSLNAAHAYAIVLQDDGKIVAGGDSDGTATFLLTRYLPNGNIDSTFDGDGILATTLGGSGDHAYAMSLQPDHRLLATGASGNDFATVRYDVDGVPDRPSAPRRAESTFSYDEWGRLYQSSVYNISQSTGSRVSSTPLSTNLWFNNRSQVVKESDPGGLVTKSLYDGAGRLSTIYSTDGGGDSVFGDADDVVGDAVLEQVEYTYDKNGNVIFVTGRQRFHDETTTGALADPGTAPKARVSYSEYFYDASDRLTGSVDLGTNGGSAYTRDSSAPARSDTKLVSGYSYDLAGNVKEVTDPRGIVTRSLYDALGRAISVIADYVDGTPSGDTDQTTQYTYDGDGHVLTLKAVLPSSAFQTTQYVYGVGSSGNLYSNDLLATVKYPDKSTGSPSTSAADQESYAYNFLGQPISSTDRNGSVHSYSYDVLGRLTADAITTLGSGVDGTVRRLTYSYDTDGRAYQQTSYDAQSGGSIVNQVQEAYNGLGQLIAQYQNNSGAVNTSTSPKVQYAYSEMASGVNNSRLTKVTYPNGRILRYEYNAGVDSSTSRVSFLADDSSGSVGTHLEEYSYLGLGTIVERNRPEPGTKLTYIKQTGESNGEAGDQYAGIDRFGRVVDQRWLSGTTNVDRYQYGYDRDSNVVGRDVLGNGNPGSMDEAYFYDNLNRLTRMNRGSLASGTIADASATYSRSWSLDQVGNWSSLTTDTNGGGSGGSTTATRNHNAQNELTDMDTGSSGNEPAYDNNGNQTTDEAGNTYKYDAWNHLVAYNATTKTYSYDALGRRITETVSGPTVTHLYYSSAWQVLEERLNSSSNASAQYVWGQGYVNDLILRDRDADSNSGTGSLGKSSSGLEERLYAQQDANYNVTSLTNTSGSVVERYQYDPHGKVTYMDGPWGSLLASADAWQYLFQGGRQDATTGDFYFQHRDYDVDQGRWKTADPTGYPDGLNRYQSDRGNPISLTDAQGLAAPAPAPAPPPPPPPMRLVPAPTPTPGPQPSPTAATFLSVFLIGKGMEWVIDTESEYCYEQDMRRMRRPNPKWNPHKYDAEDAAAKAQASSNPNSKPDAATAKRPGPSTQKTDAVQNIAEHMVRDHPERWGRDLEAIKRDIQNMIDKAPLQSTNGEKSNLYWRNGRTLKINSDGSGTLVKDENKTFYYNNGGQ